LKGKNEKMEKNVSVTNWIFHFNSVSIMLTTEILVFSKQNYFHFFDFGQFQECPKSKFQIKFVKK